MTTENQTYDPYEAVIMDLRSKRDKIDAVIASLEAFRSAPGAELSGAFAQQSAADTAPVDQAGMFLGMSIVDASKKLLTARKRAMPNAEILAELKAGGLVLTGADPVNVVSSVLTRRFNNVGDVVRVSRGTWGLKEWYPGRNFKSANKAAAMIAEAVAAPTNAADHFVAIANALGEAPLTPTVDDDEARFDEGQEAGEA